MRDNEIAHQKLVKCPKQYCKICKQLFTLENLTTNLKTNSKSNETGCIALAYFSVWPRVREVKWVAESMSDKIAAQRLNNILCCKDILWQESRRVKTQPHIILSFSQKKFSLLTWAQWYIYNLQSDYSAILKKTKITARSFLRHCYNWKIKQAVDNFTKKNHSWHKNFFTIQDEWTMFWVLNQIELEILSPWTYTGGLISSNFE